MRFYVSTDLRGLFYGMPVRYRAQFYRMANGQRVPVAA
jgi:hypothetical protein